MDIFKDEIDRQNFIIRMKENLFPEMVPISARKPSPGGYLRKLLPSGAFTLLAYCLMPNHFHFLVRQNTNLPVSKFILKVCGSYVKYFNLRHERVGSLYQDQYKAVRIENDAQLLWLSAYIHNNPKVAGLCKNLDDYTWSSYLDYFNSNSEAFVDKFFILKMVGSKPQQYQKFVSEAFDKIKERKGLNDLFLD
jgi:REP element-mobilizing transposase RayT